MGMDHFECRRYVAIRRHLVITAISHLFLSEVRLEQMRLGEKAPVSAATTPCGPLSKDIASSGSVCVSDERSIAI